MKEIIRKSLGSSYTGCSKIFAVPVPPLELCMARSTGMNIELYELYIGPVSEPD